MTYPTIRPELTLDFANSRQLDPRITFSRSSSATYLNPDTGLITTASDHEARFEKEGLLIEESRTNLQPYSQEFDNAAWSKSGSSITANSVAAPDGTMTADTLTGDGAASTLKYVISNIDGQPDIFWQHTCYFKKGTNDFVQMAVGGISSIYANFDLNTGTLGSYGSFANMQVPTITKVGNNGWYRCTLAFDLSGGSNKNAVPVFAIVSSSTSPRLEANSLSTTVHLWGAQVEEGSFPSSYVPTSGSTVTRSADVAQITGDNFSSWYSQSESTVVTKMTDNGEPNTTNNRDIYYLGTGSSSGNNRIITTTGSGFGAYVQTTGAQVSITGGWYTKGVETVGAFAFKQDNFALATDGVIRGTDNSGDLPTCNRLYLFMNRNKANTLTGHISRLSYYSRRLTDLELETLTL